MKTLLTILLITSSMYAGFFPQEESKKDMKEQLENKRLCKLFTKKAEEYKKSMREDELAHKTLKSYEKRANIYCTKS